MPYNLLEAVPLGELFILIDALDQPLLPNISSLKISPSPFQIHVHAMVSTTLPTVDQFPAFADTVLNFLESQKCIWYLPNKKRACKVPIGQGDMEKAKLLVSTIRNLLIKAPTSADSALQEFAKLAEICCCAPYHRNKVFGSGLAKDLADRWYRERIPLGLQELRLPSVPKVETQTPDSTLITFAKHQTSHVESFLSILQLNIDLALTYMHSERRIIASDALLMK
ncbi:hypothetical protein GE09DRAFT_1084347 [Coniochaeta sp. 2T2.1]|nr:hypothetical protein GE09DRAFT_1084347 [Coniochaeta sp. 2T2.1]